MNISVQEINQLYQERKRDQEPWMKKMREIAELANGEVRVVLPEVDKNERATVVNLFPGGLDALATRAASIPPDQSWPPLRDGIQASEDKAWARRQAGLGWSDMNEWGLMDRLRFRHHFAWGTMPVTILPTSPDPLDCRDMPHWSVRSPLTAYPAPCENKLSMYPSDAIFACRRPRAWLKAKYGAQLAMLTGGDRNQQRPDDMFDVLEYMDADEIVLCAAGAAQPRGGLMTQMGMVNAACVELERIPNLAGVPLAVFPGRITLDHIQGALDQMLPAYHKAAQLDALNILAIMRGIFPDTYVVGHPGDPQSPEIITDADGLMGIIGEVAHGQVITVGNPTAGAQAAEMAQDRLERSQRIVAGLPAEVNGESGSNIRTARRGEQVLGSAIDMPIQEAQDIMAVSKQIELKVGVAIQKGWFGKKPTSFYIPNRGFDPDKDKSDYVPDEIFETDLNYIKYSMPGTDANSIVIALGQRINMGTMSIETAMEVDPAIEDATMERVRVQTEGMTRALLTSIEQGAQQGTVLPQEIALIAKALYSTKEQLFDVVIKVHDEMQKRQAAQQQLPPGAPGAMPGLGGGPPGQQPGQPPSNFTGPPSSPALAQILGNLSGPGKQGAQEAAQAQPPQPSPAMAGT